MQDSPVEFPIAERLAAGLAEADAEFTVNAYETLRLDPQRLLGEEREWKEEEIVELLDAVGTFMKIPGDRLYEAYREMSAPDCSHTEYNVGANDTDYRWIHINRSKDGKPIVWLVGGTF